MTIQYNPQQLNISFLFCWRGTIFPLVLSDPMFWLLMAVHVLILHRHGMLLEEDGVGLPPLDWEASTIALSLLTFFLVFYGNHCYQRYFELHGHCVSIGQAMGQWAHLIRVHFGSRSVAQRWNMMRPMLGAMHIHYAYLRCEKSADGQEKMGVAYDEWRAMRATNLFTRAEVEQLDVYKGNQSFLATSWALGEVKSAILRAERGPSSAESDSKQLTSHRNKDGAEEANLSFQGNLESMPQLTVYKAFDDAAKSFLSECIASMEMLLQPVPFPYFHVLKLLMLAALLILSYALVELVDAHRVLSLTIYSITLLIMIGLQQVAIGMSDPFGDDEVDFDLEAFVRSAYDNSVALLLDQRMPLGDTLHSELRNPLSRENVDLRMYHAIPGSGLSDKSLETPRAIAGAGGHYKGFGAIRERSRTPTPPGSNRSPSARVRSQPTPSEEASSSDAQGSRSARSRFTPQATPLSRGSSKKRQTGPPRHHPSTHFVPQPDFQDSAANAASSPDVILPARPRPTLPPRSLDGTHYTAVNYSA